MRLSDVMAMWCVCGDNVEYETLETYSVQYFSWNVIPLCAQGSVIVIVWQLKCVHGRVSLCSSIQFTLRLTHYAAVNISTEKSLFSKGLVFNILFDVQVRNKYVVSYCMRHSVLTVNIIKSIGETDECEYVLCGSNFPLVWENKRKFMCEVHNNNNM